MPLTIQLNPAQETKVVAAFGSTAAAETWLRDRLIDEVIQRRHAAMQREALERQRTAADALRQEFG